MIMVHLKSANRKCATHVPAPKQRYASRITTSHLNHPSNRLTTRHALWPKKPNEFEIATCTSPEIAPFGT
jgi:hypothetical protein